MKRTRLWQRPLQAAAGKLHALTSVRVGNRRHPSHLTTRPFVGLVLRQLNFDIDAALSRRHQAGQVNGLAFNKFQGTWAIQLTREFVNSPLESDAEHIEILSCVEPFGRYLLLQW
ncbi:hypothetical protein KL86APRO_11048 [uncultured Alphaproteobacteria bacterium]|uniref:Uncharacterized protein n=1 Tax=uncultured Alphaproteobacteria bacterium TaxID=91750 RepID=A0A212JH31_9PROT|nr:hypothetical protein KL86APRO_11048 [uncultured Alphaproteobacteria bacterium]